MENNIKWEEIKFSDLFDEIYIAKSTDLTNISIGDIPFIGRSSNNNGFQGEYAIPENRINLSNSITISMVGVPKAFYQEFNFACSQNMLVLQSKKINIYSALFLCTIINEYLVSKNYNYGYPVSLDRIKKDKIVIPKYNSKPDYLFMENYIKKIFNKKKDSYKKYILKEIENIKLKGKYIDFNNIKWGTFTIGDICEIDSGIDIYDNERVDGTIPYITSTSTNNGIKYFISNMNKTYEKNAISVNRNGSVGYAFFHKYNALYSNDCRKIKLKINNNEFTALFIANQIMSQKEKYSYGYKLGTDRLRKQKILLPITKNGNLNYIIMENYIKQIMLNKLNKYLKNNY